MMKKTLSIHAIYHIMIVIGLCLLLSPFSYGLANNSTKAERAQAKKAREGINHILNQFDENINIGIKVKNLSTGQALYSKNADRFFVPASNMKLFTATAGLLYLGPNFTFDTKVLASNKDIKNGTLNSNVYFKFNADPTLTSDELEALVNQLKQAGIQQINGDIVVDDSTFDRVNLGPGWMWDDAKICFSSPVSAVIVNRNCYQVVVKPGNKVGSTIKPRSLSQPVPVKLKITATTQPAKTRCGLDLLPLQDNSYELSGCLPLKSSARQLSIAVNNPRIYTETLLSELFKKAGIKVNGQVVSGKGQQPLVLLAEHHSPPLIKLVGKMLKKSDNLISDSVFKTLGAKYYNGQGTWRNSAKAIRAILQQDTALKLKGAKIVDGAGLSRYNLVTPDQMVQLLTSVQKRFNQPDKFVKALPISGIDGTLRYRMKQTIAKKRVLAKTGAMANVSALSGYIKTQNNQLLAFSIIVNGAPKSLRKYRRLEDQICQYLTQI